MKKQNSNPVTKEITKTSEKVANDHRQNDLDPNQNHSFMDTYNANCINGICTVTWKPCKN